MAHTIENVCSQKMRKKLSRMVRFMMKVSHCKKPLLSEEM